MPVTISTYLSINECSAFLLNEISTIFVNQNVFLAMNEKSKGGFFYKLNGIILVISFFVTRVLFNCYNLYHMVAFTWVSVAPTYWPIVSTTVQILVVVLSSLAFLHAFINFLWFYFIGRAACRKLCGRAREKRAKKTN
jgi:TLC domain